MYLTVLFAWLAAGAWLFWRGLVRARRARMAAGVGVVLAAALFFGGLSFWIEALWFESVGYTERFWTFVWARLLALAGGALAGGGGAYLLTRPIQRRPAARRCAVAAGLAGGLYAGGAVWDEALLWLNRVDSGIVEPVLGRDTGFYLFALPFYDHLYWLLLWTALVSVAAALYALLLPLEGRAHGLRIVRPGERSPLIPLAVSSAALAAVLAWGKMLDAFHLLYSPWGVVAGAGWTDVHVRLPGYRLVAAITLVLGASPLVPAVRRRLRAFPPRLAAVSPEAGGVATLWLAIAAVWVVGLVVAPMAVQWLVVEPNEISFERPYISNNIDFTRRGFRLEQVEERSFPAADRLTPQMIRASEHLLSEVRLWDWRALDAVYKQFQEIRLYYEFHDVDMDRYAIGGGYRQVMASAREIEQSNLPSSSQTFVNRRFKYTHGYGLTVTTVSDFTPDGLPNMLVKDIPPRSSVPELEVERPQIYYGELTDEPVIVNSREEEFDYPQGDANAYVRYAGAGGVPLGNLVRKLAFGWRLDGTQLFLSSYPTPESRVMFHRSITERAATLAPFLTFDTDPYVVLAEGRIYWILDAYTTSRYYPYSEPFFSREVVEYDDGTRARRLVRAAVPSLNGVNYVRNAVKVVIDAYDGAVDFYAFDPEDPILRTWRAALPGLFRDASELAPALRAHVRYPADFLLAQGLVYAKYHMRDPAVFYNQEDLWVRATEKYYSAVQPVEPYYVMWQLPDSGRAEFVLILPFTPKNRQVMIGWIAGLCDGDNYGRFLAYKFPKERRVFGPQQVETKIDQDGFLSEKLTLWDQRGSNVIRGNVLAIPIGDTLLYVEPIYLRAETAAFPELRIVVVMHGDQLSYGPTFDEALLGLFDGRGPASRDGAAAGDADARAGLAHTANTAFKRYLELQAEGDFEAAARELGALRDALDELVSEPDAR